MGITRKGGQMFDEKALLKKIKLLPEEAAFLLGVKPRTVRRYMTEGKLAYGITLGGHRRPLTQSVKKFI